MPKLRQETQFLFVYHFLQGFLLFLHNPWAENQRSRMQNVDKYIYYGERGSISATSDEKQHSSTN